MTKLQLLHRALNERLMAAVEQIMEMVGGTVLEYEEETVRARKENEALRRRLRWIEGASSSGWQGPSEPVSIPDEFTPSQEDESAVSFEFGPESDPVIIKTESTDFPLCGRPESSVATLPQNADQASNSAGTSAGVAYSLSDGVTWDSAQSYMAPLDFDPTSGPKRVSQWSGQSKRQRMSFACPDCGKVFGVKHRLLSHMRIHSKESPYTYRRRKDCFYGENKKNRKLPQLSRETVDDLSNDSEQMNRSSASPDGPAVTVPLQEEEEPEAFSFESDHNNSDEPATTPIRMRRRRGRKRRPSATQYICYCPYCPGREFTRPCLAMHMKTHKDEPLVKVAQSPAEVERKLPKKPEKKHAVKKSKVAAKRDFPCPECDKAFDRKARLLFHMNSHKSKKALLQKSLKMGVQTKPEETVAIPKNREVQNVKEKTLSCPHCAKVFIHEGWLKTHIRMQHKGKKNKVDPINISFASGPRKSKRLLKQLRKRRAEAKAVTDSSKCEAKRSKKSLSRRGSAEMLRATEDLETVTTENQGVIEETEESQVGGKSSQVCEESNMVVDGPKIAANEAVGSAGLPQLHTDEPINNDASNTDEGTSNKGFLKRFSCKMEQEEMGRKEAKEGLDEKTSTSLINNHNPNTAQTPQGSPNKELLQKSRTRGQGPFPCPFCGKVFAWEMRLLAHMQIHCGEKPYPYRQRKKHFYGDLKRGQLPNDQEPHGNNNDESEQSVGEETVNTDNSTHLNSTESTALEDSSAHPGLLPQTVTELSTTINQKNQRANPHLDNDIMSHFYLQPRIVLKPITTEYKDWSSVPEVLQSACSETSGIDHEQPSCSVSIDKQTENGLENKIVSSKLSTSPLKGFGLGTQNSPEKCCFISEEEIVSVVVCSPQRDSHSEPLLDNACGSRGIESSDGRQEEEHDCNFVSETIIIDDRPEKTTEGTKLQSGSSEGERTKWDCNNIPSMKLTIMPHSTVIDSLFKQTSLSSVQRNTARVCVVLSDSEDGVDEDVSRSYRPTASVPTVHNKPLAMETKLSEMSSNDSNFPASDAAESVNADGHDSLCVHDKSADVPSKETDAEFVPTESMGPSISDDPLTRDQMTSTVDREVEDSPVKLEGPKRQTSSTGDNSALFKMHHCFYCKQPHYSMMAHLQSVHPNEPEVAEALAPDKSSQERSSLLELLQTRGNVIYNTSLKSKNKLQPHRTNCPVDDRIYCIYCLGLFNKKLFTSHLKQCKGKSILNAEAINNAQKISPENKTCFEMKSVNFPKPSPGQESTDCRNEELSLLMRDVDQETTNAPASQTSSVRARPDVFRHPWESFSPPHEGKSTSNNTSKSSMKARTSGTRRKRRSLVQNQSLVTDTDLLAEGEMSNSKTHVCQYCKATFCSPYTLRRHEYTHTGERPFWCHHCNVGFIQRYRLVKHIFAYHGDTAFSPDQEKLKRTKRRIQGGETPMKEQTILEPSAISHEEFLDAINVDTEENVVATNEDTEPREYHWEETGHSEEKDYNTDCYNLLFTP